MASGARGLRGIKGGRAIEVGVAGRRGKVISGRRATDRNYKSTFHSFFFFLPPASFVRSHIFREVAKGVKGPGWLRGC